MSVLLLVGAIALATAGCALLALSQPRHWLAVTGRASGPDRLLRRIGWLAVAASLGVTILRDGMSFAVLAWPMHLGLGGVITSALLTWTPQALRPVADVLTLKP